MCKGPGNIRWSHVSRLVLDPYYRVIGYIFFKKWEKEAKTKPLLSDKMIQI